MADEKHLEGDKMRHWQRIGLIAQRERERAIGRAVVALHECSHVAAAHVVGIPHDGVSLTGYNGAAGGSSLIPIDLAVTDLARIEKYLTVVLAGESGVRRLVDDADRVGFTNEDGVHGSAEDRRIVESLLQRAGPQAGAVFARAKERAERLVDQHRDAIVAL